jgi:hypothetical protein
MSSWIKANKQAWFESRATRAFRPGGSFMLRKGLSYAERQRVLRKYMRTRMLRFYRAANRGDVDEAFRAIADGLAAWKTFVDGIPGYKVSRTVPSYEGPKRVVRGRFHSSHSRGYKPRA